APALHGTKGSRGFGKGGESEPNKDVTPFDAAGYTSPPHRPRPSIVSSLLPSTSPFPYAGEASALVSSVLWAGAGIVFRRLKGRVPAAAMNLAKNGTAAACFLVLLLALTGSPWPRGLTPRATAYLVVSGVLGL